jgi:GT2 family glycosyltransferase
MQKSLFISVIVVTRNRSAQLRDCITSLTKTSHKPLEIIIIDQSDEPQSQQYKTGTTIRYVQSHQRGKAKGLNEAIMMSKGAVLAFTDDDCIVDTQWLHSIATSFKKHPDISAVFGQTKPFQPNTHKGLICPSTILKKKQQILERPVLHWKHVGFGNNMAITRKFFEEQGLFKEWLGPGSVGNNGEDAEIILRLFSTKHAVLSEPAMIVSHNKWLTPFEYKSQETSYLLGAVASYGYYFWNNNALAQSVIKEELTANLKRQKFFLFFSQLGMLLLSLAFIIYEKCVPQKAFASSQH